MPPHWAEFARKARLGKPRRRTEPPTPPRSITDCGATTPHWGKTAAPSASPTRSKRRLARHLPPNLHHRDSARHSQPPPPTAPGLPGLPPPPQAAPTQSGPSRKAASTAPRIPGAAALRGRRLSRGAIPKARLPALRAAPGIPRPRRLPAPKRPKYPLYGRGRIPEARPSNRARRIAVQRGPRPGAKTKLKATNFANHNT